MESSQRPPTPPVPDTGPPASMVEAIFTPEPALDADRLAQLGRLAVAMILEGRGAVLAVEDPDDTPVEPVPPAADDPDPDAARCVAEDHEHDDDAPDPGRTPVFDPIETVVGVQERLTWLGHYDGAAHGRLDEATRKALSQFQEDAGLAQTTFPDGHTRRALVGRTFW